MKKPSKPVAIQFLHPGKEQLVLGLPIGEVIAATPPCGGNGNRLPHRRKFMRAQGKALVNGVLGQQADLQFWGEWEGESRIESIYGNTAPRYRQTPIRQSVPQVTSDPLVFGKHFIYSHCMQYRTTGPTLLNALPDGSLLLFGSHHAGQFRLDTVLVTKKLGPFSSAAEFFALLENSAAKTDQDLISNFNIGPLWPKETDQASSCEATRARVVAESGCFKSDENCLTLYRGISYDERTDTKGLFSFVPAQFATATVAFNRVSLSGLTGIRDGMTQGFNVLKDDKNPKVPRNPVDVFQEVLDAVKDANCFPAWEFVC